MFKTLFLAVALIAASAAAVPAMAFVNPYATNPDARGHWAPVRGLLNHTPSHSGRLFD
jgi:hypothetical protein